MHPTDAKTLKAHQVEASLTAVATKLDPPHPSLSTSLPGHAKNIFLVIVQETTLSFAKDTNVDTVVNIDTHFDQRRPCATGEIISLPLPSKEIKPLSNRWSIVGVRSNPFSPSRRSSLLESRQGWQ